MCEAWAVLRQGRTELIKQRGAMVTDADPDAVAFRDLIAEDLTGRAEVAAKASAVLN